uniref:RNase H type-1 domain-containing protein n=1 Tax=Nicotiana tabacum TaxID=4097 RepID=A0A1S4CRS1_TOBAC|nr:PREDICTED: uncharacterized protein LOC107821782 [Nicotiana tabacum]
MISIHTEGKTRDALIQLLLEFKDVFAWSYDDMPGLSVDLVVHKLPTHPDYPPVQQKQRKFKTDISDKIKEEVTKQLKAGVIRVVRYTTWLANVVPVPKKDGKIRVCVDYRDLNKASPKDNFPLPNIHILVDNCAKHEGHALQTQEYHVRDLRKFFERLRKYDLKLNPAKCAFVVPSGKLLGFIVSRRGIELDPTKIKAIQNLSPPKTKKEVMSLMGRLNYISRFIAQLTTTCEPIFKLLKKDAAIEWTDECQQAFDKIKEYLSNPPVLVPPEPGRPLFLYLAVLENSFGCVLGQHDVTGKKEQAIYYLSKKFTAYEAKYTLLEKTCCALTWVAQKLRHYLLAYTTYLITRLDPIKYIFQKPMPTGRLAKWQVLLTEFDIVYVTRTAMKAQALADHLAENPVDDEYQPLNTFFPDEEINSIEITPGDTNTWKMFFDGAVNAKGVGIGAILISPTGQHYPATARLRFFCTNNTAEYEACIMGMTMAVDMDVEELLIMGDSDLIIKQAQREWETRDIKLLPYRQHVEDLSKRFKSVEFKYIPRFHNELADVLATLAAMLPYPGNTHIDPLEIQIRERHGYCDAVEVESNIHPWYHDIKRFLKTKEYPEQASGDQRRTIRRRASKFFLSGEVLYKRTPDLNLLRCVDAKEAGKIMNEVHSGDITGSPWKKIIFVLSESAINVKYMAI